MSDSYPRVTATHAADESQGSVLGVSTPHFWWVVLGLALGAVLFTVLLRRHSLTVAAFGAMTPAAVVIIGLRWLEHGHPAGLVADAMDSCVTRGNASLVEAERPPGRRLSGGFPDAYQIDDLTLFGGPSRGHVARGWFLETPDLQSASVAESNRFQDALAAILRQPAENEVVQITLTSGAGDGPRLLAYRKVTESCVCQASRRLRNLNLIDLGEKLTRGELRRRQVALFVTRPLAAARSAAKSDAATPDPLRLDEARNAFAQWENVMTRILEGIGGRVVPMTRSDVVRLWVDRFNPSFRSQPGLDSSAGFDPAISLTEFAWNSDLRAVGDRGFLLDGFLHLAMSLKRLPAETYPTLCHALTHLPFGGMTLVARIKRLAKEPVLRKAQSAVDRIHQQQARRPDERLAVSQAQMDEKIRRLSRGEVVPMEFELTVLLRASSSPELDAMAGAVKAAVHGMNGAQIYEATLPSMARNLFANAIPGNPGGRRSGFVHYGEDRYVADLLPVSSTFQGHPGPVEALFTGNDHNLVNIVAFLGEGAALTPQNTTILGAPGVGKSMVLEKVLLETDPFFAFTAIVDFGSSQSGYPRSHGIEPIVLRLDGTHVLNPFDTGGLPLSPFATATQTALVNRLVGVPRDEDKARRQHSLLDRELQQLHSDKAQDILRRWPAARREAFLRHSVVLHQWMAEQRCPILEAFLEFRDLQLEHPELAASRLEAVTPEDVRDHESRHPREVEALVFAYLQPEEHLRLSSVREHLEVGDEEQCRWLSVLLVPWTEEGAYGRIFDGVSTMPVSGAVQYFELGQLPKAARDVADVIGFQLINHLHHACLTLPRAQRKRIVVEELSRFLEIQGAEGILRELAESFRKYNVQLIATAQTYSRIADTPIRAALVGATRAWLIFNTGDRRDIERLGADLGLAKVAQEAILRFPRPDQQTGQKFSEFLYYHTDARQPVCGAVRYFLLGQPNSTETTPNPSPVIS